MVYSCNNKSAFRSAAVFFRFLLLVVLDDDLVGGRATTLTAYCIVEDLVVFGGATSSWTEPHAPLPRRRPIVHGLFALPITWPCGEEDIVAAVLITVALSFVAICSTTAVDSYVSRASFRCAEKWSLKNEVKVTDHFNIGISIKSGVRTLIFFAEIELIMYDADGVVVGNQ
jgi:hypothetical protein